MFVCASAEASASRVAELNPYVSVDTATHELNEHTDLQYLSQFQVCIKQQLSLEY